MAFSKSIDWCDWLLGKPQDRGEAMRRSVFWCSGGWMCLVTMMALIVAGPALASGDVTTPNACGNESLLGFSALLSECRGLEMVTPPYEAGEEPSLMALSTDGTHMINKSLGTYAGRQSGSKLATYLIKRGESGWDSIGLSPSSALFPAQQYLAASSDLSRSLWRLRSVSEPITGDDLYIREADGSLVKVGSFVPPADAQGPAAGDNIHFFGVGEVEYQDAASDLSHILFDIKKSGPLWPFDTTIPKLSGRSSLYEYTGTNAKQPVLVGVSDGSTILKGFKSNPNEPNEPEAISQVLPAGSLISDCETTLGSHKGDGYNAMSVNGGTIFFTAAGLEGPGGGECRGELVEHFRDLAVPHAPAVNELFARIGETETVPISEPPTGACASCAVGEPERAAEFAGASSDGSKVFFLSEQEYFGGESGLNLFEYDFDAPAGDHLLPISGVSGAEVLGVARVSEDGTHVYFVATNVLAGNANQYGRTAVLGEPNLYLFSKDANHPLGTLTFVTQLSNGDSNDWDSFDSQRGITVTPDGQFAVFASRANVASVGAVISGFQQIFEYNARTGELVRVSRGDAGYPGGTENADNGRADMPIQNFYAGSQEVGPTRVATELAVSADGSTVAFSSPSALTKVAREQTGVGVLGSESETNAYVFHSNGGVLSTGEVYLVATRVYLLEGLDASGEDVFFKTAAALLPFDGDGAMDIYDARIDGGVADPARAPSCSGEDCLASPPSVATGLNVSSEAPSGGGSVAEAPSSVNEAPAVVPAPSRAQLLAGALRKCRRGRQKLRKSCEARARKKYAPPKRQDAGGKAKHDGVVPAGRAGEGA